MFVKGECPCNPDKDIIYMGEHLSIQSPPGNYYLITRPQEPYGHGVQLNVSLKSDVKANSSALADMTDVDVRNRDNLTDHFLVKNTYNSVFYPNDNILKLSLALTKLNSSDTALASLNVQRRYPKEDGNQTTIVK